MGTDSGSRSPSGVLTVKSFYVELKGSNANGFAWVFRSREDHSFGPDFRFGWEGLNGGMVVNDQTAAMVAYDWLLERGWELFRSMSPDFSPLT